MDTCFQCFGADDSHYLGKKGTKRVLDQHFRNRVSRLLGEGKDKSYIRSYLTICEECYMENYNGLLIEKEDEYEFELNIERKVDSSGIPRSRSYLIGRRKTEK